MVSVILSLVLMDDVVLDLKGVCRLYVVEGEM